MHEFNLPKIKIPEKDFCNWCPCLRYEDNYCKYYKINPEVAPESRIVMPTFIRPEICKANDKEGNNG